MESPTQTNAQLELKRAYLMVEQGDLEQARERCALAKQLAPQQPLPQILEANILSAQGAHKEALALLRQVTKRWPDEALGHIHFAEVCFMMGRVSQAQRALEVARAKASSPDQVELIETLSSFWGSHLEVAPDP